MRICKPISRVIQTKSLKMAGHVFRDKLSPAHLTVIWDPVHDKMSHGKLANTLVDTIWNMHGIQEIKVLLLIPSSASKLILTREITLEEYEAVITSKCLRTMTDNVEYEITGI